jgi:hypothetical protein
VVHVYADLFPKHRGFYRISKDIEGGEMTAGVRYSGILLCVRQWLAEKLIKVDKKSTTNTERKYSDTFGKRSDGQ